MYFVVYKRGSGTLIPTSFIDPSTRERAHIGTHGLTQQPAGIERRSGTHIETHTHTQASDVDSFGTLGSESATASVNPRGCISVTKSHKCQHQTRPRHTITSAMYMHTITSAMYMILHSPILLFDLLFNKTLSGPLEATSVTYRLVAIHQIPHQ